MSENGYAQSQGMMLLNRVVEQVGPLFTSTEAQGAAPDMPPQRVNAVLSQLTQAGWLVRLKRGAYAVTTPIFDATIHPYAVATFLVSPVAISHWSALTHHGFTTQIPPMVQASTPSTVVTPEMRQGEAHRPRGRVAWRALGFEAVHARDDTQTYGAGYTPQCPHCLQCHQCFRDPSKRFAFCRLQE